MLKESTARVSPGNTFETFFSVTAVTVDSRGF
jgi:hypothetical protein